MIDPADNLTASLPVDGSISVHFSSSFRVYSFALQQDLLGDWTVMQSWGGKFNQRGGGKIQPVQDFSTGMAILNRTIKLRQRHGYQLLANRTML